MTPRQKTQDRFTPGLLLGIAVLLALIAVALWSDRPALLPAASAQIPDSGLQRNQQLIELRKTNQLLDAILEHLKTKPIKVRVVDTDQDKGTRPRRSAPIRRGG